MRNATVDKTIQKINIYDGFALLVVLIYSVIIVVNHFNQFKNYIVRILYMLKYLYLTQSCNKFISLNLIFLFIYDSLATLWVKLSSTSLHFCNVMKRDGLRFIITTTKPHTMYHRYVRFLVQTNEIILLLLFQFHINCKLHKQRSIMSNKLRKWMCEVS